MERKINTLVVIILFLTAASTQATFKNDIYSAYVSGDMQRWKTIIDRMEEQKSNDDTYLLELVNYQYGYIGWAIGEGRKTEARSYLNLAESNLTFLEKKKYKLSILNAYKAAFYGYRIELSAIQAPFLGPKSLESARLAKEIDSLNYLGYMQYGNVIFYMPAAFGGSKKEGIKHYLKAESIMEASSVLTDNDWNYLSLLIVIAKAYTEVNDLVTAKSYYEKVLKIEPDFVLVKKELYPDLIKKM